MLLLVDKSQGTTQLEALQRGTWVQSISWHDPGSYKVRLEQVDSYVDQCVMSSDKLSCHFWHSIDVEKGTRESGEIHQSQTPVDKTEETGKSLSHLLSGGETQTQMITSIITPKMKHEEQWLQS